MVIHLFYIITVVICFNPANGQLVIKDAGIEEIDSDDIAMIFFITLDNVCKSDIYISVRSLKCCQISYCDDCKSMSLIGGDLGVLCPGCARNVTLIYPNLYLSDREGICSILVVYNVDEKVDHFVHKISFDTRKLFQESQCSCKTPDLDTLKDCTPVDCTIKYSGCRSYFNTERCICEEVPHCISNPSPCSIINVMYNPVKNRCQDCSGVISTADLALLQEFSGSNCCDAPYMFGNMKCHHGEVDKSTGECKCHDSHWVTSVTDEPEFVPGLTLLHMCNINRGSWTYVNSDKIFFVILFFLFVNVAILLKLIALIWLLSWLYNWCKRRNHEKEDRRDCGEMIKRSLAKLRSSSCDNVSCKQVGLCTYETVYQPFVVPESPKKKLKTYKSRTMHRQEMGTCMTSSDSLRKSSKKPATFTYMYRNHSSKSTSRPRISSSTPSAHTRSLIKSSKGMILASSSRQSKSDESLALKSESSSMSINMSFTETPTTYGTHQSSVLSTPALTRTTSSYTINIESDTEEIGKDTGH